MEKKGIPRVGSHPMSKILKNSLIAELIWIVGAATQTFAPGGKHPRAATVFLASNWEKAVAVTTAIELIEVAAAAAVVCQARVIRGSSWVIDRIDVSQENYQNYTLCYHFFYIIIMRGARGVTIHSSYFKVSKIQSKKFRSQYTKYVHLYSLLNWLNAYKVIRHANLG